MLRSQGSSGTCKRQGCVAWMSTPLTSWLALSAATIFPRQRLPTTFAGHDWNISGQVGLYVLYFWCSQVTILQLWCSGVTFQWRLDGSFDGNARFASLFHRYGFMLLSRFMGKDSSLSWFICKDSLLLTFTSKVFIDACKQRFFNSVAQGWFIPHGWCMRSFDVLRAFRAAMNSLRFKVT